MKTPISRSPSPEPDHDPGSSGSQAGKEDDKKKKDAPEQEVKKFRPGGPQEMAGKIILASKRGDWMTVESLLQLVQSEGIDTRYVTEGMGWTPLHFAAKDNRVGIASQLMDLGYKVNARGIDGTTPLHLACLYAREDMIRLLLLRNADPSIPGGPKSQTALHLICCKSSLTACVPLQLILKSSPLQLRTFVDSEGNIPLFCAIDALNHSICHELLTDFVTEQVTYVNSLGENCVHFAVKKRDLEMWKLLYEYGADFNHQNKNGDTVLHYVCRHGMESFARFLYAIRADASIKNHEEETALHIATSEGNHRLVELLVEKFRASVHDRTKDGSTLMHLASKTANPAISSLFIKKGVPLYTPNKRGAKAIHLAAMTGNRDIVRSVLLKGENVDTKTNVS